MSQPIEVPHTSNSHVTYKVGTMAATGVELYGAFFIDNPDSMQIDLQAVTVTTWDDQIHDIAGVDFLSFGNRGNDSGGLAHIYLSDEAREAAGVDNNPALPGNDNSDTYGTQGNDNSPDDSPNNTGPIHNLANDILFVGHSLVNTVMPEMVAAQIAHLGGTGSTEYQMTVGASLKWIWNNSDSGQGVNAQTHLALGETEILVITKAVPLINHTEWSGTNEYASNYYNLAVASNPGTQVYLYETWHSNFSGTGVDVPYDSNDHIPWRERLDQDLPKWEAIVDAVNEQRASGEPEMLLIPAGQALGEVYDQVQAGNVPGITSEQDFFEVFFIDDIHMSDLGNFFISMVQTATIYGADTANMTNSYDNQYGNNVITVSDELMGVLNNIVIDVVTSYTRSGVDDSTDDNSDTHDDGTNSDNDQHDDNSHVTFKTDELANTEAELYGAFFQDNPDSMQIDLEAMTVTTWDGQAHDISGVDFLSFGNRGNDSGGLAHMYLSEEAAAITEDTVARGGTGPDVFTFGAHHGDSLVVGFEIGEDRLYLEHTFTNFSDHSSVLEAAEDVETQGADWCAHQHRARQQYLP